MLPHLSYSPSPPTPLRSLPYKSHDPSFNYLTTQAGRIENLKLSRRKREEVSAPSPPISFAFVVKTHFQSFLGVASDV